MIMRNDENNEDRVVNQIAINKTKLRINFHQCCPPGDGDIDMAVEWG